MDIWVVGTSNGLFIKVSYTETKSSEKTVFLYVMLSIVVLLTT